MRQGVCEFLIEDWEPGQENQKVSNWLELENVLNKSLRGSIGWDGATFKHLDCLLEATLDLGGLYLLHGVVVNGLDV